MHTRTTIVTDGIAAAVVVASLVTAAHGQAPARQLLGPLFQDHAVWQRDRPIAVWGTAAAGERVTVSLNGAQAAATADVSGRWTATLPAMAAGGPYTLEARAASGAAQSAADILVGDVWLCSGQSNMEFNVAQSRGGTLAAARAQNDRLRLLTVPHAAVPEPAERFEPAPAWQVASPQSVRSFSAVCYYCAAELQRTVPVPMGLVNASWGGAGIEAFVGESGLRGQRAFAEKLDVLHLYAKDVDAANQRLGSMWESWWRGHGAAAGEPWMPDDAGEWREVPEPMRNWKTWGVSALADLNGMVWYRRTFQLTPEQASRPAGLSLGGIDEVDETWVNGRVIRNTFGWGNERTYRLPAGVLHAGDNVVVVNVLSTYDAGGMMGPADHIAVTFDDGSRVPLGGGWRYRMVPLEMGRPPRAPWESVGGLTTIYNGMIAPLGHYGFRGVVWYQGETNADAPGGYEGLLASLMSSWRTQFGSDLPFLIVQLPGFGGVPTKPVESNWADVRDAQRRAVAADAHAGLAVTIDLGEQDNIHPARKLEVGIRLARAARHAVYGEAIKPSGPVPLSASREPGRVVVTFGDVEGRLVTYSSAQAIGFELCGSARGSCRFVTANVDASRVILPLAAADPRPTRVRFCWGDSPLCNLSDGTGLPVGPFEIAIR
jgi:sialate O-acetylesterase